MLQLGNVDVPKVYSILSPHGLAPLPQVTPLQFSQDMLFLAELSFMPLATQAYGRYCLCQQEAIGFVLSLQGLRTDTCWVCSGYTSPDLPAGLFSLVQLLQQFLLPTAKLFYFCLNLCGTTTALHRKQEQEVLLCIIRHSWL